MPEVLTAEQRLGTIKTTAVRGAGTPLITAPRVARRVHQMGRQISKVYAEIDSPLVRMSSMDYHDGLLPPRDSSPIPDAETLRSRIGDLEKAMKAAAKALDFEKAAELRDELRSLRELQIFR